MITATNCSPIKPPSFKSSSAETMSEASELIRETNGFRNIDEDSLNRLKNIVEEVEVNPDSKVRGPLKTFALTVIALATGTLATRGAASRLFALGREKKFAQKIFSNAGENLLKAKTFVTKKAGENTGKFKKVIFQGLETATNYIEKISAKGVKAKRNTAARTKQMGENLTKKVVDTIAGLTGFSTTAAGLSVDKNNNGKSDILEFNKKKENQKAVTELAAAVLDVM